MKPSLLFISHRIPYPPNKGDKIRAYNILKYLAQQHEIYLAFLIDDPSDVVHLTYLTSLVREVFYDAINPRLKKVSSITALLGKSPVSVPYFYSVRLQKEIDGLLDRVKVDAVFCSSSPTAEYLYRSRHREVLFDRPIRIMDLIDMDSLKWRQYADTSRGIMRWVYRREARCLEEYERKIAGTFDHLLLVSESEKALFVDRIPVGNVTAMPNGVDTEYFRPDYVSPFEKKGPVIVFTGAMDYWPNVQGVVWFVGHVFPQIKRVWPDVVFYIVGARPTSEVTALAQTEGVKVTGFVEDVRDYVAMADVCVVPLRIARGMQNKVLEAMAMGKSVVTTPGGLEGVSAESRREVAIASHEGDFSGEILKLFEYNDHLNKIGDNARSCVEKHYSWKSNLSLLITILRQ